MGIAAFVDGGEITVRDRARAVTLEPFGPAENLRDVWASAADDVWALGPALAHWDGRAWSIVEPVLPDDETVWRRFDRVTGCPDGSLWMLSTLGAGYIVERVHEDGALEPLPLPPGGWPYDRIFDLECDAQALWVGGAEGWRAWAGDALLDVIAEGRPQPAVGGRIVFVDEEESSHTGYVVAELVDGAMVVDELELALEGRSWEPVFGREGSFSRIATIAIGAPGEVWMQVNDVELVGREYRCGAGGGSSGTVPCTVFEEQVESHLFHRAGGEWVEVEAPGPVFAEYTTEWAPPEPGALEAWMRAGVVRVRAPD